MKRTEYLKLSIPGFNDNAKITDLNANALILEQNISNLQDNLATRAELQKLDTEVKAIKDNAIDISDIDQKLAKTDNTRTEIFVEAQDKDLNNLNNLLVIEWLPEFGELKTGTTIRIKVINDYKKITELKVIQAGDTLVLGAIKDLLGLNEVEDIKAGSIITVIYNGAKNSFSLQNKGGGYAKVDYELLGKGLTKGVEEPLAIGRYNLGATTVGNMALFAGGCDNNDNYFADIDVYLFNNNGDLIKEASPLPLSMAIYNLGAASVGDIVLFAGGWNYTIVDAYKIAGNNITKKSNPSPLSIARSEMGATSIGDTVLFAGGSYTSRYDAVDAYKIVGDSITKRANPMPLSAARNMLKATSVDNIALFAGGWNSSNTVDAYKITGNNIIKMVDPPLLSTGKAQMGAVSIGNIALFGGDGKTVDAYKVAEGNIIKIVNPDPLSIDRYGIGAASMDDIALFAGGYNSDKRIALAEVDVYKFKDDNIIKLSNTTFLSVPRSGLKGTSVGNMFLFAGGLCLKDDVVDSYKIEGTIGLDLLLPKGSKYKFKENGQEQIMGTNSILNIKAPNRGYVKYKKGNIDL